MTDAEFDKFLEELSVVLADIAISPEFAWKHYNKVIFDLHNKKNLMRKDEKNGEH